MAAQDSKPAALAEKFKTGLLILALFLLAGVFLASCIWLVMNHVAPTVASGRETILQLGWVGAYEHYTDAFRKSLDSMKPVDCLFFGAIIICWFVAWAVGSGMDELRKDISSRLDALGKQLKELNKEVEDLKRSIENLDV